MQIFNGYGSLRLEDKDFLRLILHFVLQAAARGVWDVMDKKYRVPASKLPTIPELKGHKHVYVWDCNEKYVIRVLERYQVDGGSEVGRTLHQDHVIVQIIC